MKTYDQIKAEAAKSYYIQSELVQLRTDFISYITGYKDCYKSALQNIDLEKEKACIDFVTWINDNQYGESRHQIEYGVWFRNDSNTVANSTKELYDIFIKEKSNLKGDGNN